MSWASFHVLEVMSSPRFQQKRVGYLAAIQSYRDDDDVLMLATNLLKRDLTSSSPVEVSVSLSAIATIVTPSLAQDVHPEIVKMLSHSKPYIRKKAVLAMYKIFLQYPEALRTSFSRLRDRLDDSDPSVVSATVNVICELAKKHSKNYVPLAPQLYQLLTTSSNNWMMIKILKLFSSLAPIEPRLKPKLLPQIMTLIQSTSALSLQYECINCIVSGGMLGEDDHDVAGVCVEKLSSFVNQGDQNLKYVGLLALGKIVKVHPVLVGKLQGVILECLKENADSTIRERALELANDLASEHNVETIVNLLLSQQLTHASISYILDMCCRDTYSLISDFEWFLNVLKKLALVDFPLEDPARIGETLRDLCMRVPDMREEITGVCYEIFTDGGVYLRNPGVLPPVLFCLSEYPMHRQKDILDFCLNSYSHVRENSGSSNNAVDLAVCVCIVKVFGKFCEGIIWSSPNELYVKKTVANVVKFLSSYLASPDYELQDFATQFSELFKVISESLEEEGVPVLLTEVLPSFFAYELNPVAPDTQKRIPFLDLDLPPELEQTLEVDFSDIEDEEVYVEEELIPQFASTVSGVQKESLLDARKERLEKQRDDPFYISRDTTPNPLKDEQVDVDSIPVVDLQINETSIKTPPIQAKPKRKVKIIKDEQIDGEIVPKHEVAKNVKKNVLIRPNQLDQFELEDGNTKDSPEIEQMKQELKENKEKKEKSKVKKDKEKKPKTRKSKKEGADGEVKEKKRKKRVAVIE